MKHKSYNPFKMLGSYLGLVIMGIIFLFYVLSATQGSEAIRRVFLLFLLPFAWLYNIVIQHYQYLGIVVFLIYGFLLGWGIHSLVRALKR